MIGVDDTERSRPVTARLTLPETHRLMDKAAFDRVFEDAQRSADRYFTVLSSEDPTVSPGCEYVLNISGTYVGEVTE